MPGDMKANIDELMKEAQKMQKKMQEAQNELANLVVIGEAGGGLVKIEMNGRHDARKAIISKSLLEDDQDMLEDLVVAAINDAVRKIEKASREKIGKLTAGLNLPAELIDKGDE